MITINGKAYDLRKMKKVKLSFWRLEFEYKKGDFGVEQVIVVGGELENKTYEKVKAYLKSREC